MTLGQLLSIVEIRTKLISVSTFLLATLFAAVTGAAIRPGVTILLAVAILAVDMGTTAFNSFFDYMRGVDNRHFSHEPDKVLVHEGVAPGHALIVSVVLYMVAAVTGLIVAWMTTWWLVVAGLAGMLVGFLYTGGPRPISHTPLGELFSGGFLGGALFLVVVLAHRGSLDLAAVLASVPSTLVIAGVLSVNNACDLEGDRAAGRKTLAIVLGPALSHALVYAEGVLAFGLLLSASAWRLLFGGGRLPAVGAAAGAITSAGRMDGAAVMAGSATAPAWLPPLSGAGVPILTAGLILAAILYRHMAKRGFSHVTKRQNMQTVLVIVADFTVCYAITLCVGLVW